MVGFDQFPVYINSLELAKKIEDVCGKISKSEYAFIKDQIRRAASSIALNIAEGAGKWSKKDKANFYKIARGSAYECIAALDLFMVYKLVENDQFLILKQDAKRISRGLSALIMSMEGKNPLPLP